MKVNWVWLVLLAAIALAACFLFFGMSGDAGLVVDDSDMPKAEDFDKTPPTGDDLKVDEIDISFSNGVDKAAGVTNRVSGMADKVK